METIYNLFILIIVVVIVLGVSAFIKPSLIKKITNKSFSRKNIALISVSLFLGLTIFAGLIEPESVKQARLEKEKIAQIEKEKEQAVKDTQAQEQIQSIQEEQVQTDPRYYWHEVVQVVDGDTVKARVDGKVESIRIIGIDSPESTNKNECYGDESSDKAKEFLSGKWIQLEADNTQDNRDKYSRLLRYVWFDNGTDFGRRMIEEGYAKEYTYSIPYNNQSQYKETEQQAKDDKDGLWSSKTCDGKAQKPVEKVPATTKPSSSSSSSTSNSGGSSSSSTNSSSGAVKKSSTGICHAPGTTYYDRTKNYTPYNSLDACLKSGGRLPKR